MQVIIASVNEKALKSRARTRNLLKKAYEEAIQDKAEGFNTSET